MDIIGEFFAGVGIFLIILFAFLGGCFLLEVEWVMPSTFEAGVVRVDEDRTYLCRPDDRTKKIAEVKRKLEELK